MFLVNKLLFRLFRILDSKSCKGRLGHELTRRCRCGWFAHGERRGKSVKVVRPQFIAVQLYEADLLLE